jgi:hypothetical protein
MTGEKNILIPFGVTLASGRGNGLSKGALLYWNAREETAGSTIFKINNSSVRITGIRFKGPTTGVGERLDTKVQMGCFEIVNTYETVEIDHNEFYGWLRAAIDIDKNSLDPSTISKMHVHDNYFHHNLGFEKGITSYTFGYGVVVGAAYALIEKNIFDQNRHAIAGNGSCHSGYEARWNVVLDKNDCCGRPLGIREGSHSFDMHRRGGAELKQKTGVEVGDGVARAVAPGFVAFIDDDQRFAYPQRITQRRFNLTDELWLCRFVFFRSETVEVGDFF